jgi:uncharacterized membrane protein (UPF0127 family)
MEGVIVDETAGVTIASCAATAATHWSRFRGLMLAPALAEGEGLVIHPCGSIHMMFMRFAIDAVFYDRDGRVTRVARGVRPWLGLAFGGRGAKGVVELPVGAAAGVQRGDQLRFAT